MRRLALRELSGLQFPRRSFATCIDFTRRQIERLHISYAGALESAGVPAFVEGEHLTSLQGEIPTGASAEFHVSIVDEEQLPRASLVARGWFEDQSREDPPQTWTCAACGETHEAQFRSCWQCGMERDAP